jgi:hypothetical protein
MNAPFSGATLLIDIVIAVTLVELLVLAVLHRRGGGLPPGDFIPTLLSGLCLMCALRAGLTSAGWGWVAAGLLLSGVAHAVDLHKRWRRLRSGP